MCCLEIRGLESFGSLLLEIILNFLHSAQIPAKLNSYKNASSKLLVHHRKDDLNARRIVRTELRF